MQYIGKSVRVRRDLIHITYLNFFCSTSVDSCNSWLFLRSSSLSSSLSISLEIEIIVCIHCSIVREIMAERSLKDLSATFAVVICLNDLIYRLELVCNTNRALVKQTTTSKGNIARSNTSYLFT